ncbi:hypothetical protein MMC26_007674 [Xylographa opegraphella]|nr:hypothetical protein [Xylographa opegraphella]
MKLKDLLRKKDQGQHDIQPDHKPSALVISMPEFTILRTDTNTRETIEPPSPPSESTLPVRPESSQNARRLSRFRSFSNASASSREPKAERRLSSLLNLRSHSHGSANVPTDLPSIDSSTVGDEEREARWEQRATILAKENPNLKHGVLPTEEFCVGASSLNPFSNPLSDARPAIRRSISDAQGDDHIQEAIRLHEAGDLTNSTKMFGRLANPNGENNALSQVLYGLALRHGWGIPPDPSLAINYLSQAASNSATFESQALSVGMKGGGAAKGELVLAIYELANCFRHGWGVRKDPMAARSHYETAANLGDTDAMNEAARCYEEGFGGKRDKVWLHRSIPELLRGRPGSQIATGSSKIGQLCVVENEADRCVII